jgi:5-methylcytosine-specific restriction endonuclease McrA
LNENTNNGIISAINIRSNDVEKGEKMSVLALDISGVPRQWISFDDAIKYHATDSVAWSMGETVARYRGGVQNNGIMSYLETTSIIAIRGHGFDIAKHSKVALSNRALFGRDRYICAYCGGHFPNFRDLSREHVIPVSRGGANIWTNCVTACKTCNSAKGNRLLQECGMELLYVPYEPNHAENMILLGRNITADQMDYLCTMLPKHSRLLKH